MTTMGHTVGDDFRLFSVDILDDLSCRWFGRFKYVTRQSVKGPRVIPGLWVDSDGVTRSDAVELPLE
jgi:hypothetical protein